MFPRRGGGGDAATRPFARRFPDAFPLCFEVKCSGLPGDKVGPVFSLSLGTSGSPEQENINCIITLWDRNT